MERIPAVLPPISAQFDHMLGEIGKLGDKDKVPRTLEKGTLKMVPAKDWTSGFFAGSLWLHHELTGDAKWRTAAEEFTRRVESAKSYRGTHDLGFMIFCSFGNGYRITGKPEYRDVILQGSETLALRYKPEVGLIRSWDFGTWKYPVIIDNMMNLEMLEWAAKEFKQPKFSDLARSHADKTIVNHFRPDASSWHVVDYNPTDGSVVGKQTHQGFSNDSAWARGQGWGLYGYTMMARMTGKPEYRAQARKIAAFILKHPRLPEDGIPYWDFDASGIPNEPRDASAGALIASALLELSGMVDGEESANYLKLARKQLLALSSPAYLAKPGTNGGFLLLHSTGNKPGNSEVDVPLNYADYYFLEALKRYRALGAAE